MKRQVVFGVAFVAVLFAAGSVSAQPTITKHLVYQAVNPDGTSAYAGGHPIYMEGVILNNPEDMLDGTPAYDPGYHPWQLGAQWQIFVQATDPTDFGGTACWMGQNYGNVPWNGDPIYSYTDAEWLAELARLNKPPDGTGTQIRKGDKIRIYAKTGLFFKGKRNINEAHNKNPANDFDIKLLVQGYGLPDPTPINLLDVKNSLNQDMFDETRATGSEHYQASLVIVQNVKITDGSLGNWGADGELVLECATGRTFPLKLGLNPDFDTEPAPTGWFDVVGIFDQESPYGQFTVGYRLWVMGYEGNFTDSDPIPEPCAAVMVAAAALACLAKRDRRRSRL